MHYQPASLHDAEAQRELLRLQKYLGMFHEDYDITEFAAQTTAAADTTTWHDFTTGKAGNAWMLNFVKHGTDQQTRLMVNYSFTFFLDAAGQGIFTRVTFTDIGGTVRINAVADNVLHFINPANTHTPTIAVWTGSQTPVVSAANALPASTYSIKVQYRFFAGGVYNFKQDVNDYGVIMVREWPQDRT